ncbi:MAG TPA: potassium channel family protein [Kineosporiaceae bacterium]|nr:potassium channel family protein [Kineosporiaceae bacterium]
MRHPAWSHLLRWAFVVSGVTAAVVVLAGTAVWGLERNRPDSNLNSWGDSIWWAVTTITTVGYGEHYPVTVWGRVIAVCVMVSGVTIIGAVAAIVAFGFAGRLAERLEEAVSHVESQVEHVEAEVENVEDQVSGRTGRVRPGSGLRALTVGVTDAECAASLTWLLARLGWHPDADSAGIAWRQGGLLLRVAVRPWDVGGIQGRLTFSAGSPERLERIAREATRHGFRRVSRTTDGTSGATPTSRARAAAAAEEGPVGPAVLRTSSGFEVVLVV